MTADLLLAEQDEDFREHEHSKHTDYKCAVDVEFIGDITEEDREDFRMLYSSEPENDGEVRASKMQTHALIYTDGSIVVTLYEYVYAFWFAIDGNLMHGLLWKHGQVKLSNDSLGLIKEFSTGK